MAILAAVAFRKKNFETQFLVKIPVCGGQVHLASCHIFIFFIFTRHMTI